MRTIEKTIYQFDELSEKAKEKAREWYRSIPGDYYAENVFQYAATIANILGIDDLEIYYSGFWCQGDGACFEGDYCYKAGAAKAIREYAPHDTELHRIADELQAVQRKNFYQLTATCAHSGRYYHEYCMTVDVYRSDDKTHDAGDDITELMRYFARWIYRQLETEYDYQNSDEVIDETIIENEYEFYENGERA